MRREKRFTLASEEGVDFHRRRSGAGPDDKVRKVGDFVMLELDDEKQETALIAAGWLEPTKGKEE